MLVISKSLKTKRQQLKLENVRIEDQVQSKECQLYWTILTGMIDEVVLEPNLLTFCFGNEDIPAAWLRDGPLDGGLTERGRIRLERANQFIYMIRNYTQFEYGRKIPITHATFGSASIATINIMRHLDVDIFGSNPYGLAILVNSYAMPNSVGIYSRSWPDIPEVP
ncbi:MAG: hypothetical protein AAF846_30135, partial [Chloroflexota bacterium]